MAKKLLALMLASTLMGVTGAMAQDASPVKPKISAFTVDPKMRSTTIYTAEQLANAKDLSLRVLKRSDFKARQRSSVAKLAGDIEVKGRARLGQSNQRAAKFPLSVIGRLFFETPDGLATCTAQFISENVLLTAAHCVRENVKQETMGKFYEKNVFMLQYRDGKFASKYETDCMATFDEWLKQDGTSWEWDYAMIKTTTPSQEGYLGYHLSWWDEHKSATLVGYPTAMDKGEKVQVVKAKKIDVPFELQILRTRHGVSKFTQGASGGPWVAKYSRNPADGNWVIGVNSFIIEEEPGSMFGPYLNENFLTLLQFVQNGCK